MPRKAGTLRAPLYVIGPSIAYIPLTRGQFACVDWDDARALTKDNNWFAIPTAGADYRAFTWVFTDGKRRGVAMHTWLTSIYSGQPLTTDHKRPGNPLDNRRANLRPADRIQQCGNRRMQRDSIQPYKGVTKWGNKWRARVGSYRNKTARHLGLFLTAAEAHAAYLTAAREMYGDFTHPG